MTIPSSGQSIIVYIVNPSVTFQQHTSRITLSIEVALCKALLTSQSRSMIRVCSRVEQIDSLPVPLCPQPKPRHVQQPQPIAGSSRVGPPRSRSPSSPTTMPAFSFRRPFISFEEPQEKGNVKLGDTYLNGQSRHTRRSSTPPSRPHYHTPQARLESTIHTKISLQKTFQTSSSTSRQSTSSSSL